MEKRDGYKKTRIGWIPEDWDLVKFENVMVLQRGFDLPVKKRKTGKFPLIASNGVIDCHSECKVKGPGVITGRSGTLGMVHYVENDYWPLNTTLYLKEMHDNNPRFLYYFLQNFDIARFGTGTGVPTLNRNYVHKVDVALPPIPEQQKIADILTTVDDKISSIEDQIQQTQQLKKGLMEKLLTEGIGHTEFKDTKIGRIPKSWDVVEFGKLVNNFDKKRIPIKAEDRLKLKGEYPYYGAQGIIDYVNDFIFDGEYLLIAEDGENVKSRKNDIAFIVNGKFWVNNHAHIVQSNDFSIIHFLRFILNFININKYITGMAQPKLNKSKLNSILIQLPSLPEQKQIADILSAVDDKFDVLQSKKTRYETLKKGLMQQLLTGERRVKL